MKSARARILWGHDGLRTGIDAGVGATEIMEGTEAELEQFARSAAPHMLYD